jgi:hypothetical protein
VEVEKKGENSALLSLNSSHGFDESSRGWTKLHLCKVLNSR